MKSNYTHISQSDLHLLTEEARNSPRLRKNLNLHELDDPIQRFFNALEPYTYIRPHRHSHPPKTETFILIQGSFLTILFNEDGSILDVIRACQDSRCNVVIDIKPGVWHSIICEESDTVYFEVKSGPYIPLTDKDFAVWSPEEGSKEAEKYLSQLHERAHEFLDSKVR